MNPLKLLPIGALMVLTSVVAANAAPTSIGTFSAWSAYVSTDANGKTCFAATQPQSSKYSRKVGNRGDTFFMVTTIPAKKITNEASTIIGFPFKAGSDVSAQIDSTTYKMFFNDAAGETAWSVPDTEPALIAAMKKGKTMTVSSVSSRGTDVTDTYSLSGVTAALDAAAKECSK